MKNLTRFTIFFWVLTVVQCLAQTVNIDSKFNLGNSTANSCVTDTCTNPFVLKTSDGSTHLWMLLPNPWGVKSGTGPGSSVTYGSNGTVTMTVEYTTATSGGVVGSPFILYGTDQWN